MDFYGNINLKDNEIQNLVFEQETSFPVDATVGSIVFKDNTLYMCVALNVADPIWIPLTASIDTYVHEQEATSTTWTITHNLGNENLILQVYNDANEMVIPDTVTPTDTNEIVVTFSVAIAGRVIVMFGDEIPTNGIGVIDPSTGWLVDFSNTSYDSVSFSVASQDIISSSIQLSTDGTKMYMVGRNSDSVYQYTLSSAWDLSTASYDSVSFSVTAQESNPYGMHFNPDGTKMYIVGKNMDSVHQYTLSSGWDLTTISYDSVSFNIIGQANNMVGLHFKSDGLKMYILDNSTQTVFQYTLSSAWDLSTASYDSVSFSTNSENPDPVGMYINDFGTEMYITAKGNLAKIIYEYTLGTAFDLSSATYNSVMYDASAQAEPIDVHFKPDGSKMYVLGNDTDVIFQYSTNI